MTNISGAVRHGRGGTAEWTGFGACDEASDMELVPTKGGMPMFGPMRKALAALCTAALLFGALSLPVRAEDEGPAIDFLSYEDALKYFDFDHAASNWCGKFGLDPATQLEEAKRELLSGTDPRLIIGLATLARDTGHAGEKLVINTAFRPACYQETLGLHDANINTGPYRNYMSWNGRNVVKFWWTAEQAQGWPDAYRIDLSAYDIPSMDVSVFYRAALRLWDNGWVSGYYARPGCSSHNSGTALDVSNYWIGGTFDTAFTYNGVTYRMEDYGIYKPLQPSEASRGETWHITSDTPVLGMGNYDHAFLEGFEVVYGMYFNPALKGWNMDGGWGIYVGAGVAALQLRLCQKGLLGERYITGYYCSRTEEAVRAFQSSVGLEADGICGPGTMSLLMKTGENTPDASAPRLDAAVVTALSSSGFRLRLAGTDDTRLSAYRVETLLEGEGSGTVRYYNAFASGEGEVDVDIWKEGLYEIRVSALDAAGNESDILSPEAVFVDMTPPSLRRLTVFDITEDGFSLLCSAADNGTLRDIRVSLISDGGQLWETVLDPAGEDTAEIAGLGEGVWTITVTASDVCGNTASYTFSWQYAAGTALPGATVSHFG